MRKVEKYHYWFLPLNPSPWSFCSLPSGLFPMQSFVVQDCGHNVDIVLYSAVSLLADKHVLHIIT